MSSRGWTYSTAGVDSDRGTQFLDGLLTWVKRTSDFRPGIGRPLLDVGYFATVLDIGRGVGLALTTDGVGTKILVAEQAGKFDTIGIDCVAMNVNDLICVGAEPIAMLDYLAIEDADPAVGEQIGKGLHDGAKMAEITIPGGELAQLREIVKGVKPGSGLDLAGAAFGLVETGRVNVGRDVRPGDVMIGLQSTGLHSNGYTLARRVLLEEEGLSLDTVLESTRRPLVDDLLAPTHIYVPEWRALDRAHVSLHAILNITGDGLFNIVRVDAPVGFVIDHLPIPQPIFTEIATRGGIPPEEMYKTFNMGIGFCFVVPEDEVSDAMRVLRSFPRPAFVMGRVVDDPEKKITIPGLGLVGKDDHFHQV
jgi:phosphoribosylformylglycinamidine cyclo-ligase